MSQPTHVTPRINVMVDQQYREEMLRLAKSTRAATVFVAWIIGIWVAISLIIGGVIGVQLAHIGSNSDFSTCQSMGGSDPSC